MPPNKPNPLGVFEDMTQDQYKQAVKKGEVRCPICRSTTINSNSLSQYGNVLFTDMRCVTCLRTWTEEWCLVGYCNINEDELREYYDHGKP